MRQRGSARGGERHREKEARDEKTTFEPVHGPGPLPGLLPVTALAVAPIGQVLYVGGVQISSTGYWTTDQRWKRHRIHSR